MELGRSMICFEQHFDTPILNEKVLRYESRVSYS